MWVKKCVKMYVSMFKMLKKLLEMSYQTGPKFTLASLSGIPSVSYFQDSQVPMVNW